MNKKIIIAIVVVIVIYIAYRIYREKLLEEYYANLPEPNEFDCATPDLQNQLGINKTISGKWKDLIMWGL